MTFKYDGLNRQVSRKIGTNGTPTYNVYDGWDLIAEYAPGATTPSAAYLSGASGMVKNLVSGNYYYQDASGSTSHLAGGAGSLLEWYRYDLQGTPIFYNSNDTQRSASAYGIRHLFTGQQWYSELGLYDLRNRYYSPDIGRFLQADAIGFNGDATNLYRYCGNNPLKHIDPTGLDFWRGGSDTPSGFHYAFGVTDPQSGGVLWFDYRWTPERFLLVPEITTSRPIGTPDQHLGLTPEQDLVVLNALYIAADSSQNGGPYAVNRDTVLADQGQRIVNDVLVGPDGRLINPVDPDTGNIYNAAGDWVGWENPDTGNIYDADGDWAGWNPNWQQNSSNNSSRGGTGGRGGGGGFGGYGATIPYYGAYAGPAISLGAPGPGGFGWLAAFSPTGGFPPVKPF